MQYTGNKKGKLATGWEFLLDCLFPKQCFVCQKEGEYLCSACFDKVELTENKCYLCQSKTDQLGLCLDCQKESALDGLIVATAYAGSIAGQMVESLKYNYVESLAGILAQLLQKRIIRGKLNEFIVNKVVVPIPLHRKRLLERGFNQSELLVKELALRFDCQIELELLHRIRYTAQQAKLTRMQRLDNIKEAFVVELKARKIESVLLVDDVVTTGSTMSSAAQALKKAGIKKVIALAVCHG